MNATTTATDASSERPRERGMVLIMTLLMLTILTLLGSAAVMRTAMDLREVAHNALKRLPIS